MTEYCISFLDIYDNEHEMIKWAIKYCEYFTYKTMRDIRTEDNCYHTLHEFYFTSEKDAMWFRLNWG